MAIRTEFADGQFSWVELTTSDLQDAGDFYGPLFGWDCQLDASSGPPRWARFRIQDYLVAGLGEVPDDVPADRPRAVWDSYVRVADLQQTIDRAVQLGGQLAAPVQTVANAGTRALIQDPTGARLGLWQPGEPLGPQLAQDLHAWCWNELCTRDTNAAREFFAALLGWQFSDHPLPAMEYHVIENQGAQNGGMLRLDQRWGSLPSQWLVYFAVASVDFHVDQVRQLGGHVFVPPFDIPEGRLAIVLDRQGAMFTLVQMDDAEEESAT